MSVLLLPSMISANCIDPADSFNSYDVTIKRSSINNTPSSHYLLAYSWAPNYCAKTSRHSQKPGGQNYLQCGSGRKFGYVLHGLWPQGALSAKNYPRACLGDQAQVPRDQLSPYLCMTPSYRLLQHEYENHGTCMPDANLRSPNGYFDTAQKLHRQLVLPARELDDHQASYRWWYQANPHLVAGSIKYAKKSKEWRFCYDAKFQSMQCVNPRGSGSAVIPVRTTAGSCRIKGNISKSGKQYYFTAQHRNYHAVKISTARGERCFDNVQQARAAGWRKAP